MTADCQDSSRLFQALDQEIQRRGRGTAAQLSKHLGFSPGWWADCRRRGRLSTDHFERVVEALGLDMSAFVCDLYGEPDLHQPQGPPPELVTIAWRRELEQDDSGSLGQAFVDEIENRRLTDPAGSLKLAECAINQVMRPALPALLGAAGYACLQLLQLESAVHLLQAALNLAKVQNSPIRSLLSKLTALHLHLEEYEVAQRLAERALRASFVEGEKKGTLASLLDMSSIAYWRQAHREGLALLEYAADVGDEFSDPRLIFTLWHTRSLHLERLGQLAEAIDSATQAVKLSAGLPASYLIKADWLRARLFAASGKVLAGTEILESVVAYYEDRHPGEATFAVCELVALYLKVDNRTAAALTIERLRPMVESASGFPPVAEAIRRLLLLGEAVSAQALGDVRAALLSAKQHRGWSQLGTY